jgi:hypothetical protein
MKRFATNINWDIEEDVNLPTRVEIPSHIEEEFIADYLSDEYGFCVNWFDFGIECDVLDAIRNKYPSDSKDIAYCNYDYSGEYENIQIGLKVNFFNVEDVDKILKRHKDTFEDSEELNVIRDNYQITCSYVYAPNYHPNVIYIDLCVSADFNIEDIDNIYMGIEKVAEYLKMLK